MFKTLLIGALAFALGVTIPFALRYENKKEPPFVARSGICQSDLTAVLSKTSDQLDPPFDRTLNLLTLDRFYSWIGETDLRPVIRDYFNSITADNVMIRLSVDNAVSNYTDSEAAKDFEAWAYETLDTTKSSLMIGLIDSYYTEDYSVSRTKARINDLIESFKYYPTDVVYEIGNEVNGEWTGRPEDVVKKVQAADEMLCAMNEQYLSTLNFHYGSGDILEWIDTHFAPVDIARLADRLDFITISYYPEDVEAPPLTINRTEKLVSGLAERFPNAAIGFGEIGYESLEGIGSTTYRKRLDELYSPGGPLHSTHPHFVVGGGIWNIGEAVEDNRTDILDVIRESIE